eukprot:gene9758-1713_t
MAAAAAAAPPLDTPSPPAPAPSPSAALREAGVMRCTAVALRRDLAPAPRTATVLVSRELEGLMGRAEIIAHNLRAMISDAGAASVGVPPQLPPPCSGGLVDPCVPLSHVTPTTVGGSTDASCQRCGGRWVPCCGPDP